MKIAIITLACLYLAFNVVTSKFLDRHEMKRRYVDGQCVVGKIAVNTFYAPAWLLKGIRIIVNLLVK